MGKRSERSCPTRFGRRFGHDSDLASLAEPLADRRDRLALLCPAAIADRARAAGRQHTVDEDLAHPDAGALERRDAVAGFRERQLLGQGHPHERGPRRIAQALRGLARLIGERRDQPIGRLRPPDAGELLADEAVLLLQLAEDLGHRRDGLRRREQPQRVAGRRGVDDDEIVGTPGPRSPQRLVDQPIDLDDRHQLVDAGDREFEQRVDVLAIEPGAVLEDLAERPAVRLQPARERARRVELDGVERGADALRGAGQGDAERVAEGVRRVGGNDEGRAATTLQRIGGRARRLADAAFSGEKNEFTCVGQNRSSRCRRR